MAEYEKSGGRNETFSKILAISQHAMHSECRKLRQGQDALEQKAVSRPGKRKTTKTYSSKLRKGLNVTVNVDFWFCNDDFCTAGDLSVLFPLLVPLSFSLGTTASCGVDLKFVFCERSGFHKAAKFVFSHPAPGVSNFDAV